MSAACAQRQDWAASFRDAASIEELDALLDAVLSLRQGGENLMLIIDCHGHYTTAPDAHQKFRDQQLAKIEEIRWHRRRRRPGSATMRSARPSKRIS